MRYSRASASKKNPTWERFLRWGLVYLPLIAHDGCFRVSAAKVDVASGVGVGRNRCLGAGVDCVAVVINCLARSDGAWSQAPPPLPLQHLLDWVWQGNRLFLYEPP